MPRGRHLPRCLVFALPVLWQLGVFALRGALRARAARRFARKARAPAETWKSILALAKRARVARRCRRHLPASLTSRGIHARRKYCTRITAYYPVQQFPHRPAPRRKPRALRSSRPDCAAPAAPHKTDRRNRPSTQCAYPLRASCPSVLVLRTDDPQGVVTTANAAAGLPTALAAVPTVYYMVKATAKARVNLRQCK